MENMNWAIGILEWIPAEHAAGDDFDEDVYLKSDVLKAMAKYSDEKIDAVIDFMKEKDRFTYRNTDSKWTLFGEILNKLRELKDGCGECEDYAEWDGIKDGVHNAESR